MGAVYQAAALSKAFKVKPFLVRDAAIFPIQVSAAQSLANTLQMVLNHMTAKITRQINDFVLNGVSSVLEQY